MAGEEDGIVLINDFAVGINNVIPIFKTNDKRAGEFCFHGSSLEG
jgi:hypothetical protein